MRCHMYCALNQLQCMACLLVKRWEANTHTADELVMIIFVCLLALLVRLVLNLACACPRPIAPCPVLAIAPIATNG